MKYIEGENRFYVLNGDVEIGEVTFTHAGDSMYIIDHTMEIKIIEVKE